MTLKKHIYNWKWWLLGTVIFLAVVQILFNLPAPCRWLEAVWEAGDLISLVGTLILGYIAMKQANEANESADAANKISNRLMDLEFERYKLENRPFVMVADWRAENLQLNQIFNPDKLYIQIARYDEKGPILGLSLFIQNTTNAPLSVEFKDGCTEEYEFMYSTTNQPKQKLMVQPFDIQEMVFYAAEDEIRKLKGKTLKMNFILENRFTERYQESFKIIVASIDNLAELPPSRWFCSLFVQEFEIGKFKKDETGKIVLVMEDL